MRKDIRLKLGAFFSLFVIVSIFILVSYLVQNYFEVFEGLISKSAFGLMIYVLLNFVGIIVAPITVIPLVIVITGIWGGFIAGLMTLIAWVLGSVVAFWISRKFGVPLVRRLIPLDELYKFEERFSLLRSFWGVVFLRMVIPVEILSYGLGLFSRIGFWKYTFASVLGLAPVAFAFGYLGIVPLAYQVILALCLLIGFLILMIIREIWY